MEYKNIESGVFISRPNRFIAQVEIGGQLHTVHVKNTGRCAELLTPNAQVILERSSNQSRKTLYDLVAVYKNGSLINMDSQAPNKAVFEWLAGGGLIKSPTLIKPEKTYGSSRLDFYIENENEKYFVEVKGVTLEENKIAMFPDAPTERGRKHLNELIKAKQEGFGAAVIFLIQMKGCKYFTPNKKTDSPFADCLKKAQESGVEIIALDCIVTPSSMTADERIEVKL